MIIDGRNLLDPEAVRSADFEYVDMGRNRCSQRDAAELLPWRNPYASTGRGSIPAFACKAPTVES